MTRQQSQAGISKVQIVIGLAVVLALMGVGLLFLGGSNKPTTTTSKNPSSTQDYVTISAWKLRAPYDGQYTITQTTKDNVATFSAVQLTNLAQDCTNHGGTLTRYKSTDDITPSGGDGVYASVLPKGYGSFDFSVNNNHLNLDITGTKYTYKYIKGRYYIFRPDEAACGDYSSEFVRYYHDTINNEIKSLVPKLEAY